MRVLDSDTVIEIFRRNPAVLEAQRSAEGLLATTVISAAELYYGAAKSRQSDVQRAQVDRFLLSVAVLDVGIEAARIFGETKAGLERSGQRLPDADLLIASICLAHRSTLVTGNGRYFARILGLATEDWIREPLR